MKKQLVIEFCDSVLFPNMFETFNFFKIHSSAANLLNIANSKQPVIVDDHRDNSNYVSKHQLKKQKQQAKKSKVSINLNYKGQRFLYRLQFMLLLI
jgi:hypothetical protein